MMHGDISNHSGMTFGFRCEDSLFKYRDSSLMDGLLNIVLGKINRAEVNPVVLRWMRYLYFQTEYSVSLVIDRENYTGRTKEFIESEQVPYNFVSLVVNRNTEVTSMLNSGELSFYVDTDYNRRKLVNSPYAIDIGEMDMVVPRVGGRNGRAFGGERVPVQTY